MDAALLTSREFWQDPAPFAAAGEAPDLPELAGHVLFETSGSSGKPKAVAISKDALLASAAAVNAHLRVTRESIWGLALPLNHVGGFGVATRVYQAGCGMEIFNGKWDAVSFEGWLSLTGVTHTSLVPAQVHDMVKAGLRAPTALTAIVVGGGHLDEAAGRAARELGWPVLASYGMSEAGSQIATQPLELLDTPYSPAPIPLLPLWNARVNRDGLLAISGPALFSGYVIDGKFIPRDPEWHVTSDRAEIDARGLTPLGRADSLVKILGELVDPEAIERELAGGGMPRGSYAIIAIPDARAEHALVPVFESAETMEECRGLLTEYNRSCPGFRRLRPPVVIGGFPRSGLGKMLRAELTKIYQDLNG